MILRLLLLVLLAAMAPARGQDIAPDLAAAPPEAAAAATPATPVARPVAGTKLLFLRLNLRTKLMEQELLTMPPERMLEHLGVASDLLGQLRQRRLTEDEQARADRNEQYLQLLTERYVLLGQGEAEPAAAVEPAAAGAEPAAPP